MVLLARRALQERFASKHRDDAAGEGIEPGSRVCVLNGRHFPLFAAGDQGEVLRVDYEAMNCDVLFEGAMHAVPVALRHLRLIRPPLNASASMAAALRSTSRISSVSPPPRRILLRREESEWEVGPCQQGRSSGGCSTHSPARPAHGPAVTRLAAPEAHHGDFRWQSSSAAGQADESGPGEEGRRTLLAPQSQGGLRLRLDQANGESHHLRQPKEFGEDAQPGDPPSGLQRLEARLVACEAALAASTTAYSGNEDSGTSGPNPSESTFFHPWFRLEIRPGQWHQACTTAAHIGG